MTLLSFVWNFDPVLVHLGPMQIRYYGVLFALAFILAYNILERIFKNDNAPENWIETLFFYIIAATIIGSRLGHVFFYGWDYYKDHLLEIFAVWHGGLASHGGAIGIVVAVWIFSNKVSKNSPLWVMDRLMIVVALAGAFIRLGNFLNSEIIGKVTDMPWGVVFMRANDIASPELPHHPTQLYEACIYFATFIILMLVYWKTEAKKYAGLLFGFSLIGIFATRFLVEFIKEPQEGWEANLPIDMGQILSIPFIIAGVYFIYTAYKKWQSEKISK